MMPPTKSRTKPDRLLFSTSTPPAVFDVLALACDAGCAAIDLDTGEAEINRHLLNMSEAEIGALVFLARTFTGEAEPIEIGALPAPADDPGPVAWPDETSADEVAGAVGVDVDAFRAWIAWQSAPRGGR